MAAMMVRWWPVLGRVLGRGMGESLVDVDWRTDGDHWIEPFDVFVAEADAAVADGVADRFGLVGAVYAITVTQVEAAGAEGAEVAALDRAEGRDDDVAVHDDFVAFFGGWERFDVAVGILFDDVAALDH